MKMSRIKTISVICLLFLTTLGFASFGRSQTTTDSPANAAQGENEQTIQALLNEVRQLRLSIQRSNLSAYHAQVIIERMRSQQQSVDRLADRLRGIRDQLDHGKMAQSEFQDLLKKIEGRLNLERDPDKRDDLEEQQETFKTRLGSLAQQESRLREVESQLALQLQTEQAKLADLNEQLDALQRELEIPPAENKPPQSGKRP
jgi:chromosome segregation ATPase